MTKDYVINPDRFKNFFNELDTRRTLLTTVTDLNTKLFTHFLSLDETLNKKSLTLDSQIQNFKQQTEKTLESLRIRETLIPEKELTLAARVQQLKSSAITDIQTASSSHAAKKTMSESLRMRFRWMDSKGLMGYLLANRKHFVELRAETAMAAEEAVDLLGFVLEAVEGFVDLKVSGKKIGGLGPTRCACGILIQAAFQVPSGGGQPLCLSAAGGGVSSRLKERAAAVLQKWKVVLSGGGGGDDCVSSGEANMFLTMVVGLGLKEDYDDKFLWNLVLEIASKQDMAKMAVALGSGDKVKEIIEELVKTGKEIDAVYIATEAGLTNLFPPVQLLKSCIANSQKTTFNHSSSKDDVIKEMNNTRAIMKCIEDLKLESEFSLSNLQKRIAYLGTAKADKKSGGGSGGGGGAAPASKTPSNKRSRPRRFGGATSSSSSFRPPKSGRVSATFSAFHQRNHRLPPTQPPSAARYRPAPAAYSYPSPNVDPYYNGAHTQTQSADEYVQYANHHHLRQNQEMGLGSYGGQRNYGVGGYDYNGSEPAATTFPATQHNV